MKERSLVAFTLLAQMAVGTFWGLLVLRIWLNWNAGEQVAEASTAPALPVVCAMMATSMMASLFHLGAPVNAWRAVANVRSSWLSREIGFTILFTGASSLYAGLQSIKLEMPFFDDAVAGLAALCGLALIFMMGNAYRLRTVPAWNTRVTPITFFCSAGILGALVTGMFLMFNSVVPPTLLRFTLDGIFLGAITLLLAQAAIFLLWVQRTATSAPAGSEAMKRITLKHTRMLRVRMVLVVVGIVVLVVAALGENQATMIGGILALGIALASEILGRLLFYQARVRVGV